MRRHRACCLWGRGRRWRPRRRYRQTGLADDVDAARLEGRGLSAPGDSLPRHLGVMAGTGASKRRPLRAGVRGEPGDGPPVTMEDSIEETRGRRAHLLNCALGVDPANRYIDRLGIPWIRPLRPTINLERRISRRRALSTRRAKPNWRGVEQVESRARGARRNAGPRRGNGCWGNAAGAPVLQVRRPGRIHTSETPIRLGLVGKLRRIRARSYMASACRRAPGVFSRWRCSSTRRCAPSRSLSLLETRAPPPRNRSSAPVGPCRCTGKSRCSVLDSDT